MDKKKKRKIIRISVIAGVIVILIVAVLIIAANKKYPKQFALKNTDKLSENLFVENELRSDNSLLEYGKVLTKYGDTYAKYTGEDISIDASNFYGISYKACTGEMVYLYRSCDANGKYSGNPTSVTYRGKNYTFDEVIGGSVAFASEEFIKELNEKLSDIAFAEDYGYSVKKDLETGRDENGYTSKATPEERYTTVDGSIKADEKAILANGAEITFIYNVSTLVKETALYSVDVEYFLPANRQNSALLALKVDNKYPFLEAANMELKRTYTFYDTKSLDIGFNAKITDAPNSERNEIRAQQQEVFDWTTVALASPDGLYKNPYRFVIQDGATSTAEKPRTISITLSREPAVLRTITIKAPLTSDTYEEYLAAHNFKETDIVKDSDKTFQFEIPDYENSISLRAEWDGNATTIPASYEVTRYNYFGGDRWSGGGDGATWSFTVDKTGWYQIGFRYNTTLTDIVAFREIKIDGVIPFEDMEEYCFPYSDGWHAASLMNADQKPYYFYLEAGKTHTITMTSKVGPLRASITSLTEAMDSISDLISTVVSITGAIRSETGGYSVDKNRDWDLDKYIVGIQDRMDSYKKVFTEIYEEMKEANGGVLPYYGSAVSVAKALFERLAKDLEDIPASLNEIADSLSSLSTTLSTVTEQPLAIDYMILSGGNFNYKKCTSSTWQDIRVAAIQFKDSFVKDYTLLGTRATNETEETKEIEVYISRGREYVEMLKSLIAEDFTPKTGIKVKVNMVFGGVEGLVMLRYVTGTAPDVAVSVGIGAVVDYACRGALVAYNDLDGDGVDDNPEFNEFKKQFLDGAFTLARYRGNYYCVPETQTFAALFYRTDIIEELGIQIPQTWDDVYQILPTLQENGMDFYYPYGVGNLYPFIYQHGGSLYDTNGMESALLTDNAYNAFVEYANLYNKYNIPYAANFYMKFKMGDMPIGIADMATFCQLKYSAPEINGKWKITMVPGHLQPDGTIDRSTGGSASCCVLIKNKGDKLQSKEGWEFVKWWMSEETQVAYAQEVESTFGVASRWSTANVNAIDSMAYSDEEIEVIKNQWSYFVESPNVLGGYYTSRYLTTALNQSVLQGDNMRIALEDAVREINKEMKRKQNEFFPDGVDSIIWNEKKEEGYTE